MNSLGPVHHAGMLNKRPKVGAWNQDMFVPCCVCCMSKGICRGEDLFVFELAAR